jgi:hypothetical protein
LVTECGYHEEIDKIFQVNKFGNIVLVLKDNDEILFGNDVFSKFFDDILTLAFKLEDLGHVVSQVMHNMQETAQLEDITDANEHIDKGRERCWLENVTDKNWGQDESSNVDPFHEIDKSVRHLTDGSKLFSPESHKDRDNPGESVPEYLCETERDFNC